MSNGQVVGVSGHYLTRRGAHRKAREQATVLDLTGPEVEAFRVVARSSWQSDDWGVRPDAVHPADDIADEVEPVPPTTP